MTLRAVRRYEMTCDGCGKCVFWDTPDRAEARDLAMKEGWGFPPQLKRHGNGPPSLSMKRVSDVCGDCIGGWEYQYGYDTWENRRDASGQAIISTEMRRMAFKPIAERNLGLRG